MLASPHVLWSRFWSRWTHRFLALEAIALLQLTATAQRWIPMPRWSLMLGHPAEVPESWRGTQITTLRTKAASRSELRVYRALAAASRVLPWTPSCLAEAATGQLLLRQSKQPGVVVIGLRPSELGTSDNPWRAHAWLLGKHGALTGGPAARGFTATTMFEARGGLRAVDIQLEGTSH